MRLYELNEYEFLELNINRPLLDLSNLQKFWQRRVKEEKLFRR